MIIDRRSTGGRTRAHHTTMEAIVHKANAQGIRRHKTNVQTLYYKVNAFILFKQVVRARTRNILRTFFYKRRFTEHLN